MPVINNKQPISTPPTSAPVTSPRPAARPAAPTPWAGRAPAGDGIDGAQPGAIPRHLPHAAPAPAEATPTAKAPGFFERLGTAVQTKIAQGTKKLLQAQQTCVAYFHQALEQLAGLAQFLLGLGAFLNDSVVNKFRPTQPAEPQVAPRKND